MNEVHVTVKINGEVKHLSVKPNERLVDTLREKLKLTSVKVGCLTGECGTCMVLYNGVPTKSCLVLTAEADNSEIFTVEGLKSDPLFNSIAEEYASKGAFQCGFCTPGYLILTYWLAKQNPNASDEEIKDILNSVLCRCTGYKQIFDAVKSVVASLKK